MKDKMVLKRKLKSALSVFMITALALGLVPGTDFGLEAHAAAKSFVTNDNAESGANITLTADRGTRNSTVQGFSKLIDGDIYTKWCTKVTSNPDNETPKCYWVEFHSNIPFYVDKYTLTTGDDTATHPQRNPKTWQLCGKLDISDKWTIIANVENNDVLEAKNNESYTFDVDVKGTWQYFRFLILETQGDDQNTMQLSELSFSSQTSQDDSEKLIFDNGCANHASEYPRSIIDGNTRTKWYCGKDYKSKPSGESRDSYWVDFHTDNSIKVNQYTLTTGNDNEAWNGRNPNSWMIKAKANENDPWTVIADVTDDTVLQDKNYEQYTFRTSREGSWKYFRFMVFESKGEGSICDGMQLSELSLSYKKEKISFEKNAVEKEYGDALFTIALTNTGDAKVTYSSDNEKVATVDPVTGEVTILDVGNTAIFAKLSEADAAYYDSALIYYSLNVVPGVPKYEVPTGLKAEVGQKNYEIELPKGWTWAETVTFSEVGQKRVKATFTPEDTKRYKTVNVELTVTVEALDKTELDTAIREAQEVYDNVPKLENYDKIKDDSELTELMGSLYSNLYGARINYDKLTSREAVNTFVKRLNDSAKAVNDRVEVLLDEFSKLSDIYFEVENATAIYGMPPFTVPFINTGDGKVIYSSSNEEVATVDSESGEVTVVDVGNATIYASLSQEDAKHYKNATTSYKLEVVPGTPEFEMPTGITAVCGQSTGEIELPKGWTWVETVTFSEVGQKRVKATFTPEDTRRYKPVNEEITVTVVAADKTELDAAIQAAQELWDNMPNQEYYDYIKDDSQFKNLMETLNSALNNVIDSYDDITTTTVVNDYVNDLNNAVKDVKDRVDILLGELTFDVVFNTNEGSDIASQKVKYGAAATKPADPTRTGFTFKGWFADVELKTPYDFSTEVKAETTIYAKWEKIETQDPSTVEDPATTSENANQVQLASNDQNKETIDKKLKKTKVSKLTAGKKSITITWEKQTAKGIKGYEIQCSTDKKFAKDVKSVTISKTKTTSKTIKKLKAKKKYYVRIRTYKKSGSKKVYSNWSKTKSIKVK